MHKYQIVFAIQSAHYWLTKYIIQNRIISIKNLKYYKYTLFMVLLSLLMHFFYILSNNNKLLIHWNILVACSIYKSSLVVLLVVCWIIRPILFCNGTERRGHRVETRIPFKARGQWSESLHIRGPGSKN